MTHDFDATNRNRDTATIRRGRTLFGPLEHITSGETAKPLTPYPNLHCVLDVFTVMFSCLYNICEQSCDIFEFLVVNEYFSCLPCGHIYGMSCIKKWLQHCWIQL